MVIREKSFQMYPHLSMFLDELESLDESECLVHAAAHGKIIDGHLPHHTLRVNNKQACITTLQHYTITIITPLHR